MHKNIIKRLKQSFSIPIDTQELHWTRTRAYHKRLGAVKTVWILAGLIMLVVAQPAFILASSLFLTFLSFAFLEK